MTSRRRKVLVGLAVLAVVLLAANIAGVLRYPGGPLRESNADGWFWLDTRPADQGNNLVGLMSGAGAGAGEPVYLGVFPRNQWSSNAIVERIRLINSTPGLELIEARLARPGTSNEGLGIALRSSPFFDAMRLYTDYQPLPAELAGNTPISDGRMWLEVIANDVGEYSFESVAVDYRIGPFSFTIVQHQALTVCLVPLPDGVSCSIDSQ